MKHEDNNDDMKVKLATHTLTTDDLPSVGLLMLALTAVLLISGIISGI